jgi:hypothetical protein
MLYEPAATAVLLAPSEVGVERLQRLDTDACSRRVAEQRTDGLIDLADVVAAGASGDVDHLEVAVEQAVEAR